LVARVSIKEKTKQKVNSAFEVSWVLLAHLWIIGVVEDVRD